MIPAEMLEFIGSTKVATICCVAANAPHCFNCYFSFIAADGYLVFKSSSGTRHEEILRQNAVVAGTIIPEHIELATIRGIQFEGVMLPENMLLTVKASSSYYLAFPFALAVPGNLYIVQINSLKFTDNTKGFGYKSHWARPAG
jgi:uncharacterized protein YhbP (UPF0306 family)